MSMSRAGILIWLACGVMLVVLGLSRCGQAQAHDFWINWGGYVSPTDGVHCCGQNDCTAIPADQVKASPAGYVLSSGEVVPYAEAQPSEDGQYWRCQKWDGTRRCFFSPQPGS